MKRLLVSLLAVHLALAPGCGTLFFHNPQTIRVTTNVPGSLVIAKNEAILGRIAGTTAEFKLDRSSSHMLLVSAHGNEAVLVPCESRFSWWRILISLGGDILLGCIPLPPVLYGAMGILTDAGSGSWQVLDDDIHVNLQPRPEPPPEAFPPSDAPPPSAENPASAPPAAPQHPCASCGKTSEITAQFCPHCGARVDAAVKPCAICGEPRLVSAVTCPHCGLK